MSHTTLDATDHHGPAPRAPGAIGQALLRLFTHTARIAEVRTLGPRFRLITLDVHPALTARWMPGDKLQIPLDGLASRTFTPFSWDHTPGRLELLGHVHGAGPGAAWIAGAAAGGDCQLRGPRRSIELNALERPALFVGDESSFGLAMALRNTPRGWQGIRFLFEVTNLAESRAVLRRLAVRDAELVERRPLDAHFAELEAALVQAVGDSPAPRFVLSGKAGSIQHLTRALKARGIRPAQLQVKAYWAAGKRGLD